MNKSHLIFSILPSTQKELPLGAPGAVAESAQNRDVVPRWLIQ